jgi:benzylsuccinate CoA-transferase BbsF subunit
MADQPKALEGLKVVVIGGVVTAPLTARYLAVHGATVVRVDSHVRIDGIRMQRPFHPEMVGNPNGGVWYANINSSMLGIALDWNKPMSMVIMNKLVRWADVVVENFSAGVLGKWGLDYSTVSKDSPGVIYLGSCLMGQTGPWAPLTGLGTAGGAISGVFDLCGWPGDEPTPIQTQYTDFVNPKFGVAAIMAALEYRRRTGRGQYLDQSQVEGGIQVISPLVMDWISNGKLAERTGNRIPEAAPHGVFRCAGDDRWVAISVSTEAEWAGLCRVNGTPAALQEERFKDLLRRKQHEEELETLLSGWTSQHTPEEMEALLQAEDIPCSVVASSRDTREDVQLNYRGFFRRVEHSVIGEHTYRGPAFRLSKTPDSQFQGPAMGEHNFDVCAMLGLSDEEVSEVIAEEAMGFEPVAR